MPFRLKDQYGGTAPGCAGLLSAWSVRTCRRTRWCVAFDGVCQLPGVKAIKRPDAWWLAPAAFCLLMCMEGLEDQLLVSYTVYAK
jgi:hypothetical protein